MSSFLSRRRFLELTGAAAGATAAGVFSPPAVAAGPDKRGKKDKSPWLQVRPGADPSGFDPWLEIDSAALRHNAKEVSRLAGGRPILAVVKNNAYGLGDTAVGPILDSCPEVAGIACVRVSEAVALREAGVRKPILNMAEVAEAEAAELAERNVWLSCWLDDSGERLDRLARRFRRPIPVHLYIDAGMGREGMPDYRALTWIEDLVRRKSARIDGTYQMFVHQLDFDREQVARFLRLTSEARNKGLPLGKLHAAPSYEVFFLPESHLDMVRPGNALLGNYPQEERAREMASLRPVFRLCARVVRVEQLRAGDSASFRRQYIASRPTWVALLPVGHTDGYPAAAANTSKVLINGRLYPVVAVVSSTHTIVELGEERAVEVGDVATLIGPDDPAIEPGVIAANSGIDVFRMITKFSALLPRKVV
jgi:alanine racemase